MTIQTVHQSSERLTIRYFPALVWIFVLLIIYGVGTIIGEIAGGARQATAGPLLSIAILAILAAITAFSGGAFVICTFDRGRDLVAIRRFGLRGAEHIERKLSDVTAIEVEVLRRSQHRIILQLRSGERLPLTPYYLVSPFGAYGINRLSLLLNLEPKIRQEKPQIWR
jgi:hypothetical protein